MPPMWSVCACVSTSTSNLRKRLLHRYGATTCSPTSKDAAVSAAPCDPTGPPASTSIVPPSGFITRIESPCPTSIAVTSRLPCVTQRRLRPQHTRRDHWQRTRSRQSRPSGPVAPASSSPATRRLPPDLPTTPARESSYPHAADSPSRSTAQLTPCSRSAVTAPGSNASFRTHQSRRKRQQRCRHQHPHQRQNQHVCRNRKHRQPMEIHRHRKQPSPAPPPG